MSRLNGKAFYPATVRELTSLLAKLPPDMPVSGCDDYCLEVLVYDCRTRGHEVYDLVFDHGCLQERGRGPWDPEKDE
ncbi:MAG: hypothetical protein ACLP9L_14775 [Thermoguttaceae bacterium]